MQLMLCALSVGAAQAAWLCTQKVHALRLMHHVWYAHSNAAHLLQGGRLEKGTRRAAGTGSSLEHPGIPRQPSALPAGRPPSAATAYQAMIALHGTLPSAAPPMLVNWLAEIPSWTFYRPLAALCVARRTHHLLQGRPCYAVLTLHGRFSCSGLLI